MLSKLIYFLSKIRSYAFCFKHLPYRQAKLCPILLHWRTKVYVAKCASIRIDNPQKYGIRIGIWGGVVIALLIGEQSFKYLTKVRFFLMIRPLFVKARMS